MVKVSARQQLVVFLVAKVGMKDAVKVASFLVAWGAVARRHPNPTMGDYMRYWKVSEATYFRELRVFRKVWPDDVNPERRWLWIEANCALPAKLDRERSAALLLAGPVPG